MSHNHVMDTTVAGNRQRPETVIYTSFGGLLRVIAIL